MCLWCYWHIIGIPLYCFVLFLPYCSGMAHSYKMFYSTSNLGILASPRSQYYNFHIFRRTSILFSRVAAPVCILTNSARGFPFFTTSPTSVVSCIDFSHSDRYEVVFCQTELPDNAAIALLGICPKDTKI